jgi:transcription antitermination factor NusG
MMMGKVKTAKAEAVSSCWIVVQTYQGQERRAKEALMRQGFEVYLPMTLKQDRVYKRWFGAPFFPKYLFMRVTPATVEWWRVFSSMGVQCVIGGENPRGLKDWVVEAIRAREENGVIKIAQAEDLPANFSPGERVRLVGDLAVEAVFLEHIDDKRAFVLTRLIGTGDSRTTVELRKLRPLS